MLPERHAGRLRAGLARWKIQRVNNAFFVSDQATGEVVNYFNSREAAARYAGSRPRSHGRVLAMVRAHLGAELPVARALDVGCGTGHSTLALLPLARTVVGLDSSRFMLSQAQPHPAVEYRSGYAEALPFGQGAFDLLTVCSAYHWFDQERFLAEAARVLRVGGWLVLYKVGSTGRIVNCPEFESWRRDVFRARYPKSARNDESLSAEKAAGFGFRSHRCERSTHVVRHTLAEYVDNLLTHSSLIRAMDRQEEPMPEARGWLRRELAPFFVNDEAEFQHEDWLHLLRREPAAQATDGRDQVAVAAASTSDSS
jgi:SAM-dependent methyltransferase